MCLFRSKVFYLDYGNSESVKNTSMRQLTKTFAELPAQAIRCSVDGLAGASDASSLSDFKSKYIFLDATGK